MAPGRVPHKRCRDVPPPEWIAEREAELVPA